MLRETVLAAVLNKKPTDLFFARFEASLASTQQKSTKQLAKNFYIPNSYFSFLRDKSRLLKIFWGYFDGFEGCVARGHDIGSMCLHLIFCGQSRD